MFISLVQSLKSGVRTWWTTPQKDASVLKSDMKLHKTPKTLLKSPSTNNYSIFPYITSIPSTQRHKLLYIASTENASPARRRERSNLDFHRDMCAGLLRHSPDPTWSTSDHENVSGFWAPAQSRTHTYSMSIHARNKYNTCVLNLLFWTTAQNCAKNHTKNVDYSPGLKNMLSKNVIEAPL